MEGRWHSSPWLGDALQLRRPEERIFLICAGQTAVDAVLALHSQPGPCRIHILSRSGNLPQVHTTNTAIVAPLPIATGELRLAVRQAREGTSLASRYRRTSPHFQPGLAAYSWPTDSASCAI
jgi:hypothetical protein